MPKRTGIDKLDEVQNARRVVLESVGESTAPTGAAIISNPSLLSQVMAEMGRKGGQIGGKRRLKTMTAEERAESARLAAVARWSTKKPKKK